MRTYLAAAEEEDIRQGIVLPFLESQITQDMILVDPLTCLICFDSFFNLVRRCMQVKTNERCFLAIGDVDGLRDYVALKNSSSPEFFGHVAGNDCMKKVGQAVWRWQQSLESGHTTLTGTFGGDEVIIFQIGSQFSQFVSGIEQLSSMIITDSPRPCSFACSSANSTELAGKSSTESLKRWISRTDRALFEAKEKRAKTETVPFLVTC